MLWADAVLIVARARKNVTKRARNDSALKVADLLTEVIAVMLFMVFLLF